MRMNWEIRADGVLHIDGYVNAVERDSREIFTKEGKCVERVLPGVFGKALAVADEVRMLLNHKADRQLASTKDTLTLTEDNIGLRATADITDEEVIEKARLGKLRGWSFGFRANKTEIEKRSEGVPRRILKDINLYEVSIIDDEHNPCYNSTSLNYEFRCDDMEIRTEEKVIDSYVEKWYNEYYLPRYYRYLEVRYNPYHDPVNGRFTDGTGSKYGGYLYVGKGKKGKGEYVINKDRFNNVAGNATTTTPASGTINPNRNYNNDVASKIAKDHYDQIMNRIEACPNEDVRNMYLENMDKIKVVSTKGDGVCHAWGIEFNDAEDHTGSKLREPNVVFLHESGHYIDRMLANGLMHYSVGYNNGEFGKTLKAEIDAYIDSRSSQLKAEFNEHKSDYAWLRENKYISDWDERMLQYSAKRNGCTVEDLVSKRVKDPSIKSYLPKYSKSRAYSSVSKELDEIYHSENGNYKVHSVSDIFGGATGNAARDSWGHSNSYFKDKNNVAIEAFAEFSEATVTNSHSLNSIKTYFPKSYEVYERMVKERRK